MDLSFMTDSARRLRALLIIDLAVLPQRFELRE
jgi:hypothetical protein